MTDESEEKPALRGDQEKWIRELLESLESGANLNSTAAAASGRRGYRFDAEPDGPMSRPVDRFGVPLPTESELEQLPAAAREVATDLAPISKSAEEAICDEIRAHARPMSLEGASWLLGLGDGGPDPGEVIGVVPRAWLFDHVVVDMGFVERQELRLTPSVILATPTRIYWASQGDGPAWKSIEIGSKEGESIPEWSELFGRGPFATFSNDDLGLDALEGASALFDLFMVDQQVVPSTLYGFSGASPTELLIGITKESSEAYGESGVKEGVETAKARVRDALGQLREEGAAPDGFVDDLFALGPNLLPFFLSGGFEAFLPMGLDPQARGAFRYSNMTQSASAAGLPGERLDPAGEPMRIICGRRGMTLPLFVEPTGRNAGSHMKVMLQSLRAARHGMQGGAPLTEGESIKVEAGRDGLELRSLVEAARCPPESGIDDARRSKREDCERALSIPYSWAISSARLAWLDSFLEGQPDHAAALDERAGAQKVITEQTLRLEQIDSYLLEHPDNAEAHLARARVLRGLPREPSLAIDAAREAIRLDPSPAKYWILALAHHDAGNTEERDRAIVVGRSLWTESSQLADLWQRSSFFEVFRFSSMDEKVRRNEASEEEALAHQACVRRALRLMPESRESEDLELREADLRVTGILGEERQWFLGICQDAIRAHHRVGGPEPEDESLVSAWFHYLAMMVEEGEEPSAAVRAAAGDYLTTGQIEAALEA